MNGKTFLDTNIIAYAFDRDAPAKRARARELIHPDAKWAISWQVVQEFHNVALHRFKIPLPADFLEDFTSGLLAPHCEIYPDRGLWQAALAIHRDTQYHYYDSLIVASAIISGASVLYSEDLQHGRRFGTLAILNPFH